MVPAIDNETGYINRSAYDELVENNCTMPNIERIIFSLKTFESAAKRDEDGKLVLDENGKTIRVKTPCTPVLATTVFFIDGTRTTVRNSLKDKIEVEEKTMEDGSKVTVATDAAKECGVVYAIVKRIVGTVDDRNEVVGDGFGRILADLVASGHDEAVEAAKTKIAKAKGRARHAELRKNAKPKVKNPSLLEVTKALAACVDALSKKLEADKQAEKQA